MRRRTSATIAISAAAVIAATGSVTTASAAPAAPVTQAVTAASFSTAITNAENHRAWSSDYQQRAQAAIIELERLGRGNITQNQLANARSLLNSAINNREVGVVNANEAQAAIASLPSAQRAAAQTRVNNVKNSLNALVSPQNLLNQRLNALS